MLEEIAKIVSEEAQKTAENEIGLFKQNNPDAYVDEEIKHLIIERAISQLSFHINSFKTQENSDNSIEEQFEAWYRAEPEEMLRKTCREGLRREIEKRRKDEDPNMSFLERYLKEHRRR